MIVDRTVGARDRLRDGGRVDLHAIATGLTLEIIADALFGAELSGRIGDVEAALGRVMDRYEEVFVRSRIPIPMRLPTPRNLRLRRAVRRLQIVVDDVVARRLAASGTPAADSGDLLADLIEAARAEGTLEARRRLRDEVLTLLLAGHETTALVVTFALLLLSRHPEEERAVLDELDAVLNGRDPAWDDLARMPYLRSVVQETMRLYPPAWALGREAVRDLELGGYRVPRGAQIFMMPWIMHRDARWFADPERFSPERWRGDEKGSDAARVTREAYFPFGAGPRACVGAGLAMLEAPLVLATLLVRWRFDVPPGFEPELQPSITLRPRGGVPATARLREASTATAQARA
jgi:cytochrome P450